MQLQKSLLSVLFFTVLISSGPLHAGETSSSLKLPETASEETPAARPAVGENVAYSQEYLDQVRREEAQEAERRENEDVTWKQHQKYVHQTMRTK